MNLKNIHNTYFIGIGGIGMSALARYFLSNGVPVAGYDKTSSDMTDTLIDLGIEVHFKEDCNWIKNSILNNRDTLVIYTPAIPESNSELRYFRKHHYRVLKRSEVLGLLTKKAFCIAIAGTHGKTTTTSMLAHLLNACKVKMTAFLGGIAENYNTNLIKNGSEMFVVEADEYDRSFLTLYPDYICVTSLDADHLDIYGQKQEMIQSYSRFTSNLKKNGKLFVNKGLPINGISYGVDQNADYEARNIHIKDGAYIFDIHTPLGVLENVVLNMPGRHNLANALAAFSMAFEFGCDKNRLKDALQSYRGVKRRFSIKLNTPDYVLIDDYAHHPEEINAVYNTVSEFFPWQKKLVIFQPHLYSRTKDFCDEFASSLSQFDEVLLMDIYAARELPIKGVNSRWLLSKINIKKKKLIQKHAIIDEIKNSDCTVVIVLGAGDIGNEVNKIKEEISAKIKY